MAAFLLNHVRLTLGVTGVFFALVVLYYMILDFTYYSIWPTVVFYTLNSLPFLCLYVILVLPRIRRKRKASLTRLVIETCCAYMAYFMIGFWG